MKNATRETLTGIVVIALTVLGIILFALGFSTGYYTFGQMNSGPVLAAAIGAAVIECLALILMKKFRNAWWPKLLTFAVTALLAYAALTLIGDRVEGIGNCILTDYDSGHGGEEAIYLSLGGAISWLAAMVFNIIGSFGKDEPVKKAGRVALPAAGAVALIAVLIPSLVLGGVFTPKKTAASAAGGADGAGTAVQATDASGTYTTTFSGAEGNVGLVQDYQFQCGNLQGLMNYDTRLTLDLTLKLNPDGTYSLLSDAYCVEAGKRAVIGDDTGLGMVSVLNADGTYTVNEDGTVTTSPASRAVFELTLDTYSSQMRGPASYKLGEDEMADGKYDSAEYPVILEAVPETVWTLGSGTIESYGKPAAGAGTYTVTISGAEGNVGLVQDYQFQCGNLQGLMNYDTRLTLDLSLTLNADGTYALLSDAYCIEAGKRAEIGDDTGLGMISTMNAEGTYVFNDDGTVTTSPASHAVFELALDTYSSQMRGPANYLLGEAEMADGTYDSAEYPVVLDAVPETVWTLNGDKMITAYAKAGTAETPAGESAPEQAAEAPASEGVTIPSDDGGTEITFFPDGTFRFWFESYSIEEFGTYTYTDGKLTATNPNGDAFEAEGDPLKLHYVTAKSDMLTGDYTIPADTFDWAAEEPAAAEKQSAVIPSDDEGTELTFFSDGTFRFWFESYSIEEFGTYTYAEGKLTAFNPNGDAFEAEGDPLKLHYVTAKSDMLTGDYTIPADTFNWAAEEPAAAEKQSVVIPSDDEGTELTFFSDGTFRFWFESYSIEEFGTYTYADGKLIVINANGAEAVAEGDPLKLHFVTATSDMLTGDYTIPASTFDWAVGSEAASTAPVTFLSADEATKITFDGIGGYVFEFPAYSVNDPGTYTFEGGVLTVMNANGLAMTAEDGNLHYISALSDQLVGDFVIDLSQLQ